MWRPHYKEEICALPAGRDGLLGLRLTELSSRYSQVIQTWLRIPRDSISTSQDFNTASRTLTTVGSRFPQDPNGAFADGGWRAMWEDIPAILIGAWWQWPCNHGVEVLTRRCIAGSPEFLHGGAILPPVNPFFDLRPGFCYVAVHIRGAL